ncbi:protease [Streptosporangium violaceochromogenes]|nr:protease [Streptosporangium violaceochromogenes]
MFTAKARRVGMALAAAALVTLSTPLPALAGGPHPSATPSPPTPETEAKRAEVRKAQDRTLAEQIAKDLNIPIDEARRRADRQPELTKLADAMGKSLGATFGGAWIDQRNGGRLTVAVTEAGSANKVKSAALAAGASDTVSVTVRHSFAHLQDVTAELARRIAEANKGAESGLQSGIVTPDNTVKLTSLKGAKPTPAQRKVIRWAQARFGSAVTVSTHAHRSVKLYCYDDYSCDPPLRSGLAIFGGGGRCTSAFTAYSGSSYYMLTAGHCAEMGAWWDVSTYSYGYQNVGSVSNYTFGWDGDSAVVSIDDPTWWQPRGWVYQETPIQGSETDYIGSYVCKQGSTTGYTCGTVNEVDATVSYPDRTLSGMTWSDACDGPGDSGSGVFSGNLAHGILSGGPDVGCGMIHEPIGRALSAWGVSLLTG